MPFYLRINSKPPNPTNMIMPIMATKANWIKATTRARAKVECRRWAAHREHGYSSFATRTTPGPIAGRRIDENPMIIVVERTANSDDSLAGSRRSSVPLATRKRVPRPSGEKRTFSD